MSQRKSLLLSQWTNVFWFRYFWYFRSPLPAVWAHLPSWQSDSNLLLMSCETFPPPWTRRRMEKRRGHCQASYSRGSYVDNLLSRHIALKPKRCTVGRAFGRGLTSQWRPSRGCKHITWRKNIFVVVKIYLRRNIFLLRIHGVFRVSLFKKRLRNAEHMQIFIIW